MARNNEYKVVIVGGSGVGKTVFLGSYFYAKERGNGKYPITMLDMDSIDERKRILETLFKGTSVTGTSERKSLNFRIKKLGMDVLLYDRPGGWSTDPVLLEQEMKEELLTADGVLFFISAWDALYNQSKCYLHASVFEKAIEYARTARKNEHRPDIPIYFIYTQGDRVAGESVSADDIHARFQTLDQLTSENAGSLVFPTGKRVKKFLSTALGQWNEKTPPHEEDYKPVNVVEPMEEFLVDMKKAREQFKKTILIIIGLFAALGLAFGVWSLLRWNQSQWNNVKEKAELYRSRGEYGPAIEAFETYRDRWHLYAPGNPVAEIAQLRNEYEQFAFAAIEGHIKTAAEGALPTRGSVAYAEGKRAIEAYLKNTFFERINPKHYKAARSAEPYFSLGWVIDAKLDTPQQIINLLAEVGKVPEMWRDSVLNNVHAQINRWMQSAVPSNSPDPAVYRKAIEDAQVLIQNPWLPDELKTLLTDKSAQWNEHKLRRWTQAVSATLAALTGLPVEQGLARIDRLLTNADLPDAEARRLREAKNPLYEQLVREWLKDGPTPDALRAKLAPYDSQMPDRIKNIIAGYIEQFNDKQRGGFAERVTAAGSLDVLKVVWEDIDKATRTNPRDRDMLGEKVARKLEELLRNVKIASSAEIDRLIAHRDFEKAVLKLTELGEGMRSKAAAFVGVPGVSDLGVDVERWKNENAVHVSDAELASCKERYENLKSSDPSLSGGDKITATINALKSYQQRWGATYPWHESLYARKKAELDQTEAAIAYLQAAQRGQTMVIRVVSMDCKNLNSWFDFNGRVTAQHGVRHESSDKVKGDYPQFNWTFRFTWTPQVDPVILRAYDGDIRDSDKCFEHKVDCRGIVGWQNFHTVYVNTIQPKTLNNQAFDNKVTMTVTLAQEPNLPVSPW